MDDDVQYLGTKPAAPEPLDDPCETPSVAGITLHVEKCGEKPAHELTFYRARSGYVNIGRKSGSDDRSMRRENDDHNAVFTCQVVSAKHAKLVFSDSGQVYVVDLHSRHGTHLLRRGETTPRMLQAEVETSLADGDVLTFGKVVGAGSYHVSPVTVRVEFLACCSPYEPATDRGLTPLNLLGSLSPILSRPRKLSSGRYGLISACCVESGSNSPHSSSSISVSSDAASSQSDQDSDIEEQHLCIPTLIRDEGRAAVKIPAFRSFIRDIYQSTASHSPCISGELDEHFEDAPGTTPSADLVRHPSPVVVVIEPSSKSRSHSPMDMATPSPSPPSEVQQSAEPAVIGAWPASRPESPRQSSLEVETGRPEVPAPELDREPELPSNQTCQSRITPLSNDALIELMHRLPPPPPFFPIGGPFSTSIASDFGLLSAPHPPHPPPPPPPLLPHRIPPFQPFHKLVSECVNSEVKGSLKSVEDRITAVRETVSDLKSRQTVTEEDVVDLQSHVEILEPESERLLCRITGAERNIATLSTLQGQMTALQKQVTTMRERLDVPEPRRVETPMEDVRACANALNNLVSEMKSLRENAEKRMEARMEATQSARAEALNALQEVVIEAKSSKRKRVDEVDEGTPEVIAPLDIVMESATCSPPLVVDENSVSEVSVPHVPIPIVPVSVSLPVSEMSPLEVPAFDSPRPKKRARTALYTVTQTAAAMAIGAAAAWSALAFS